MDKLQTGRQQNEAQRIAPNKTSQEVDIMENLIKPDPHNKEKGKDKIYEETEVTEFIGSNTPNLQIQSSVETQTTAFPQEDHVFSIY